MSRKQFFLRFILSGLTYAILSLIIDASEGAAFSWWGLLWKALFFGFFSTFANEILIGEFKSEDKPNS